jgi:hypothetical protein
MLDYAAWLERLQHFVAHRRVYLPEEQHGLCHVEIAPPLTSRDIARLQAGLGCPMPSSVEGFLTHATSGLRFGYAVPAVDGSTFEIEECLFCYAVGVPDSPGNDDPIEDSCPGPLVSGLEAMILARNHCVEYALGSWLTEPEWPIDRAFWRHALPLTFTSGGDGLAIWAHADDDPSPPVIALSHDDESTLVSPTFDVFLTIWEQCGYYWDETFKDGGAFIDASSPAAARFRASLEWKSSGKRSSKPKGSR